MRSYNPLLLALFGALALALAGCGADDTAGPTTVSGQVVEEGGGQAVPRPPRVQVWGRPQATGSGLGGGAAYQPLGGPQAVDGQGRFSFSFEAAAKHDYVLRAEAGGLGYYTDWARAPAVEGGRKNQGLRLPVAAPAWVRLDLVDELPRSRIWMSIWGWGGGGMTLNYPRDTTIIVRYLANRPEAVLWEVQERVGQGVRNSASFTLSPLDTQRIRINF